MDGSVVGRWNCGMVGVMDEEVPMMTAGEATGVSSDGTAEEEPESESAPATISDLELEADSEASTSTSVLNFSLRSSRKYPE